MATTIAKLNVMLTASSKGLTTELAKSRTKVQQFSAAVNKMGTNFTKSLNKMGGAAGLVNKGFTKLTRSLKYVGVAATAAALGFGYFVAATGNAVDENAKLSRRLGLTYNEFKAIEMAAGLAGISTEQLATGFEKMSDTIGSARMGDAAAIKSLEQIGISINQLDGLSAAKQFELIGRAINAIPNPQDKIAAVRNIFGRGGGPMLELFAGGSQVIAAAAAQLQAFGQALNSLQTGNIEFMNDRVAELGMMFEGIAVQLNAFISPYIGQLAVDTQEWVKSMGGIEGIVNGALVKMETTLSGIVGHFATLTATLKTAKDILTSIGGIIPNDTKLEKALKWNPIRDTVGALIGKNKSDADLKRMEEKAQRRMTGAPRSGIFGVIDRAQDSSAARAQESLEAEQQARNAPAIEAAIAQRQAEQFASYQAHFGPVMNSTPGAARGATPRQADGEQTALLRQIAINTGRGTIAYAG